MPEPSEAEVEAAKRAVMNELESFAIPDDCQRDWDKFAEFVVEGVLAALTPPESEGEAVDDLCQNPAHQDHRFAVGNECMEWTDA